MEAKDLMIGNLLESKTGEFEVKVEMIDNQCGVVSLLDGLCDLDLLQPIPLTEEWHNKFGVEINGHLSFVYELPRKNNMRISIVFNGDYVYLRQKNDDKSCNDSLVAIWNTDLSKRDMFVHEYQNLYKALTNEDLKIK